MVLINVLNEQEFNKLSSSSALTVVHFYAEWAAQCGQMNDVMEELAKTPEFKDVQFAKCLAEEIPDVSLKFKVSAVPTFVLIREDQLIERVDGANAGELTKKISQALLRSSTQIKSTPVPSENLHDRLKSLISAAPVMLFMKGTASEPRCGFSRQIVGILDSMKASYKTFDILNDEQVRQGLKEFSKWPTYPQLYVNGELMGGLDIVKELQSSGELESMLPKQQSLDERLKSLISQDPVMIFMKGNPTTPRCGFSKTLMEIMTKTGVAFKTFDILEDEEVRQGLKKFSNWPTYPQVYIKGELIGGLDIVKELVASGEFENMLRVAVQ